MITMRRWVIIVVILIVVTLVAAVISVASIVRYGLSAHDHPTRMEKVIAAQLRHWAVPSGSVAWALESGCGLRFRVIATL